jgi:hypothetical protein
MAFSSRRTCSFASPSGRCDGGEMACSEPRVLVYWAYAAVAQRHAMRQYLLQHEIALEQRNNLLEGQTAASNACPHVSKYVTPVLHIPISQLLRPKHPSCRSSLHVHDSAYHRPRAASRIRDCHDRWCERKTYGHVRNMLAPRSNSPAR